MRRMMTWWRDLGGLLAACLLALLVIAPTADAGLCLCADDVAVNGLAFQAAQTDDGDAYPCEAVCCLSGHCHHGGPMLDPSVVLVPTLEAMTARPVLAAAPALASLPASGLERPPRA